MHVHVVTHIVDERAHTCTHISSHTCSESTKHEEMGGAYEDRREDLDEEVDRCLRDSAGPVKSIWDCFILL